MARPTLTREQQVELDRYRVERRWDAVTRLGSLLIGRGTKWGFYAFLVWQARIAIEALAGRTTLAAFWLHLNANLDAVTKLSWTISVGLGIWVFVERQLRKKTTARLSARVQHYEQLIDPGRSSSLLTPRGDARPEDQT